MDTTPFTRGDPAASVAPDAAGQSLARFEGRLVQDGTGAPVARASVTIVGLPGATRSDNDGRFTWVPAPQPPFHVVHSQLELRGYLRNLLNDSYYANPDARWVLASGRSASLTAVVQF